MYGWSVDLNSWIGARPSHRWAHALKAVLHRLHGAMTIMPSGSIDRSIMHATKYSRMRAGSASRDFPRPFWTSLRVRWGPRPRARARRSLTVTRDQVTVHMWTHAPPRSTRCACRWLPNRPPWWRFDQVLRTPSLRVQGNTGRGAGGTNNA